MFGVAAVGCCSYSQGLYGAGVLTKRNTRYIYNNQIGQYMQHLSVSLPFWGIPVVLRFFRDIEDGGDSTPTEPI